MPRITVWQRAILNYMVQEGLRAQELHVVPNHSKGIAFSRRALETALWFDWQGHHTTKANQLIELGWMDIDTDERGIIHYTMTNAGQVNIGATLQEARAFIHLTYTSLEMFS